MFDDVIVLSDIVKEAPTFYVISQQGRVRCNGYHVKWIYMKLWEKELRQSSRLRAILNTRG